MKNAKNEFMALLCNLYIVVLLVILPLYTGGGYWQLGDAKYMLFRNMSLLCLGCWLAAGMPWRIGRLIAFWRKHNKTSVWGNFPFSSVDWAVLSYAGCVILSALCSSCGQLAWKGYGGWYMGAVSQVLFAGIYFFVSRQYDGAGWPVWLGELALFLVTVFGLLHRLGLDPLGLMDGWNSGDWEYSHMLSTLGNINWLCGYYSVALAVLTVHFLREERPPILIPLYLASVSVFVLLGIQGSQSGWLLLLVCTGSGIFLGRGRRSVQKKICALLAGFFLGMPLMEVLMRLRGSEAAFVADGNIFDYVKWYMWLIGAGGCAALFFCLSRKRGIAGKDRGFFRIVLQRLRRRSGMQRAVLVTAGCCGAMVGILLGYLLITRSVGDGFGSGRGFLWRISLEGFAQADGKDKLLGAGPDCYGEAVFNRLGVGTEVWKGEHWEGAVFTNAHSEFLSQLCNVGILGTVSYLAIFLTGLWRYGGGFPKKRLRRRRGGEGPAAGSDEGQGTDRAQRGSVCWEGRLGAMVLVLYGIHSLISFQQVLNAPLLFLVLGLCEADMRAGEGMR